MRVPRLPNRDQWLKKTNREREWLLEEMFPHSQSGKLADRESEHSKLRGGGSVGRQSCCRGQREIIREVRERERSSKRREKSAGWEVAAGDHCNDARSA